MKPHEHDYRQTPEGNWRFANPELYQKTVEFQTMLWKNGIAWHNPFSKECTPDFNFCSGYSGNIPTIRIPENKDLK